ncbi:hypothetical protein [Streptomyces sp. NPDC056479]|uniref:hypothetical protein n=1 Tax=unclassified Streptomyces TaxID=2593676 RepID=UPI0036C0AC50
MALATAVPLLLAATGVMHPRHVTALTAVRWAGLHIGLLPVFSLLVLGLVVPVWGRPQCDLKGALAVFPWAGCLGSAVYCSDVDAVADKSAGIGVDRGMRGAAEGAGSGPRGVAVHEQELDGQGRQKGMAGGRPGAGASRSGLGRAAAVVRMAGTR